MFLMSISEMGTGIYRIIDKHGPRGEIQGIYMIIGDQIGLIDTGDPSPRLAMKVLEAIKSYGHNANQVSHIFLTHEHPHHIGGSHEFAKIFPQAVFVIHNEGSAALLDPVRTILSTNFLLGKIQRVKLTLGTDSFSKMKGIDEDLIQLVSGDEKFDLGGKTILLRATQGHSAAHVFYYCVENRAMFTGDEVQIYPENPYSYYIDATGDVHKREQALKLLLNAKIDVFAPAHDSVFIGPDFKDAIRLALESQHHVEDLILDTLIDGALPTETIQKQINSSLGLNWGEPYRSLINAHTARAHLKRLSQDESVTLIEKKRKKGQLVEYWQLTGDRSTEDSEYTF